MLTNLGRLLVTRRAKTQGVRGLTRPRRRNAILLARQNAKEIFALTHLSRLGWYDDAMLYSHQPDPREAHARYRNMHTQQTRHARGLPVERRGFAYAFAG